MNGDHQQIRRWRREQQLRKTLANRPDLIERAILTALDRELLDAIKLDANKPEANKLDAVSHEVDRQEKPS